MSCKPTYKGKRYNSLEELYNANGINPQQKQEAQQLYSQYLNTLTDEPIVYKGFRNKAGLVHNTPNHSYFTNSFKIADAWYKDKKGIKTFVIPKVQTEFFQADTSKGVTTIKPQEENYINNSKAGLIKLKTDDIGGLQIQYVVNKKYQPLELGSKQDIEGFKNWANGNKSNVQNQLAQNTQGEASEQYLNRVLEQRREETINPFKEIGIIKTLKANLSIADRQKCN